jgi:hypothetical protein
MTSTAQLAANVANGKKGGVRTAAGKAKVRLNALTHGLTSREVLLKTEDAGKLNSLQRSLIADIRPVGALETLFADLIVADCWRLIRAMRMETAYLDSGLMSYSHMINEANLGKTVDVAGGGSTDSHPLTLTIREDLGDRGGLLNLERYRIAIERHLFRSLDQLNRLQIARYNSTIPQSLDIDIDVSENK